MLPNEMRGGASQQSNMELGSLGARGTQDLNGGIGGFGGLEGAQQLGGQSQAASMEQAPLGGTERTGFGGAMEAGAMGQEALGQAALGGGGRLSESAVSRMTDGSLQGGGPLQGMQGVQDVQGMQGMTSAFTGGQQVQGGMLSDGGGVSALQGQGMMGGGLQSSSLQGGLQSMMGGGLTGLQAMGGGAELGQQQMSFKKVSEHLKCLYICTRGCTNSLPPSFLQRHAGTAILFDKSFAKFTALSIVMLLVI